ncbi:hypothetical protein [Roseburia inulinivorans]|uniref:hypothetical protein n=1 Tax=Roseburia inulinivorans TaxID=360807 RepID=UPI0032BFF0BD
MKKYIVLVVTTLILTGLAGCSMTKNRYNHYGVVKYLENKYDDKFEYYETYGGTLFDSDPWKGFICTSEKYPGKHILVIYDVNHDEYHDNYFDIKYARQVDELIDSMLLEVFGDDPYYFNHYEGADITGLVSQYDADTTFEEYIAEEHIHLTACVKSDKSNEEIESRIKEQILKNGIFCSWIDLAFVEKFDKERMNDSSYIKEVVSEEPEVRHYSANMKDNKTFTDCNWEE